MMAIDVWRVQLDSRQKCDETIDLSLPSPTKSSSNAFLLCAIDFSCGILWELFERRLGRGKSHDLAEFIEDDHWVFAALFIVFFFRGEIIHRFPGVEILGGNYQNFFSDHTIHQTMWKSPLGSAKVLKVVSSGEIKDNLWTSRGCLIHSLLRLPFWSSMHPVICDSYLSLHREAGGCWLVKQKREKKKSRQKRID